MPPTTTRTCPQCGRNFAALLRRIRQGGGRYCSQACASLQGRKAWRAAKDQRATPESTKAERIRANGLVNSRVKRGAMPRPDACTECGKKGRVDGHHEDYTKPDEVEWLCRSCHMRRHNKRRTQAA